MIPPSPGVTEAILLHSDGVATTRIARFLALLGIDATTVPVDVVAKQPGNNRSRCLVLSGPDAVLLGAAARQQNVSPESVTAPFGALIFHSIAPQSAELSAVASLLGGAQLSAQLPGTGPAAYRVTKQFPAECGPLSGLEHRLEQAATDWGLAVGPAVEGVEKLIEINGSGLLTRFQRRDTQVLIASTIEILDLSERTTVNVDFRRCFSLVAPPLLALRTVFRTTAWTPKGAYANITIDDPPLWPEYGLLDLRGLAKIVDRLGCSATIGMIPWNFRRSKQSIADMFRLQSPRLGICYHGCDHTHEEFGYRNEAAMRGLFELARHRMERHRQLTGLECQPVMIYPQGVFSIEAMKALQAAGCLAAVNTESQDLHALAKVTLGDLLLPAVHCYSEMPLFVRRQPSDGEVNFALDLFLGRPLLIVTHHDFFKGGFGPFEETVRTISNLDRGIVWENLQNIVTSCAQTRTDQAGKPETRHFVQQGQPPVKTVPLPRKALARRMRIAARRYASEFRDNHLSKSDNLRKTIRRVVDLVRGR